METDRDDRQTLARSLEPEYELLDELGRGGASVVYRARDHILGREVAIKLIREALAGDGEVIARMEREARTLARLQHPNIVTLYGAKRLPGGSLALVMQHGGWQTLKAAIRQSGPLDFAQVEGVLRDLASALAYLHRAGVVHRDIKPENIFLDADTGRALLSDFGIAKPADGQASVTLTGVVVGTPAYMSPEQIDGGALTGRSDLYSLGMVGYEMLTGRRPWDGETLFNVIYKQKAERLPPLRTLRPDIPEALLVAVERAVEKDPAERWPSAEALLDRLTASPMPDDAPEQAPPTAPWLEVEKVEPAPPDEIRATPENPLDAIRATLGEKTAAPGHRRMLVAAVIVLVLAGGIGAVAFATRTAPDGRVADARIDRSAPPAAPGVDAAEGSGDEPGPSYAAALTLPSASAQPSSTARSKPARTAAARSSARTSRSDVGASRPQPVDEPPAMAPSTEPAGRTAAAPLGDAAPALNVPTIEVEEARPAPLPEAAPMLEVRRAPVTPPVLRNRKEIAQVLRSLYPDELKGSGAGNHILISAFINAEGVPQLPRIKVSSGHAKLDRVALYAVRRMRFAPASSLGKPHEMWVDLPLTLQQE